MGRSIFATYFLHKLEDALNQFSKTKCCQVMQCFFMYIGVYLVVSLISNYLSSFVEPQGMSLAIGITVAMMGYCLSIYADYRTPLIKFASAVTVFGMVFAHLYFGILFVACFAAVLTYQDYKHVYAKLYNRCSN